MRSSYRYWTIVIVLTLHIAASHAQSLYPATLLCEYQRQPLGIDVKQPAFQWTLTSTVRNSIQSAYEVEVREDSTGRQSPLWSSGKINAHTQRHRYSGPSLRSFTRYYWRVRVYDRSGRGVWSRFQFFETAMLSASDWKAHWIAEDRTPITNEEDFYKEQPAPVFKKEFRCTKSVRSARLYITGLGFYEPHINGHKAGDEWLAPGWTNFNKRVQYSIFDISSSLRVGTNAISILVGNGWYNPLPLRMWGKHNLRKVLATGAPCVMAQLHIRYADGSGDTIVTNKSWKTFPGPVVRNSVYLGEHYDARLVQQDWDRASATLLHAQQAVVVNGPDGLLTARMQPPVKAAKILSAKSIHEPKPGVYIFDLGQNFAGVARIKVKAPTGRVIHLRYGEDLYPDSTLNVMTSVAGQIKKGNGGSGAPPVAWQEDRYIARGGGTEIWSPRFTFHGFRYVEVTGWPGRPQLSDLEGVVLHADVTPVGTFHCSNPMFNKLFNNIQWTFLSNLFSVQSDCPAREKFGYGGDMFCTTEAFCFNYDMMNFYRKVLQDFADEQRPLGGITETAPFMGIADHSPGDQSGPLSFQIGFGFLMKQLYIYYGDTTILQHHYPAFIKQVRFLIDSAKGHLYDTDFGDHESLDDKPKAFTASCFYYHHIQLAAEFAAILGKTADQKTFSTLAHQVKQAIRERFFDKASGRFSNGTQTAQVFGLWYELLEENEKPLAVKALERSLAVKENHLSTGIFGTRMLPDVLMRQGRSELAYTIVDQRSFPGWGYMVEQGATTLWETWKYSDNTYSQNHPMFGSVADWFYRALLGINPVAAGFDTVRIKPQLTQHLVSAAGAYRSIKGSISVDWKVNRSLLSIAIEVPANTAAEIWLPCTKGSTIKEGGKPLHLIKDIKYVRWQDGFAILQTGGGKYHFEVAWSRAPFEVELYKADSTRPASSSTHEVWRYDPEVDSLVSRVSRPTLTIFQPPLKKPGAAAVIICPGGGYHTMLIEREGRAVARAFNKEGVVALVLKYRLPGAHDPRLSPPVPLQDVQQAIKMAREHAGEWGFSPRKIGIMGFSAGGHLAAFAGTHFDTTLIANDRKTSLRPDFMILVNPVISFLDSLAHKGSRAHLLGNDPTQQEIKFLSNELHVSIDTPPAWLVHAEDDSVVSVANSRVFVDALKRKKVMATLQLYPRGGHGFLKNTPPFEDWFARCLHWMRSGVR